MLTKKDKNAIIKALEMVDVKQLDIDHDDEQIVKWFRFGSYNAMKIACDIVQAMPEENEKAT